MSHPIIPIVLARYAWRICPQCGAEVIIRTSTKAGLFRIRYLKCRTCGWGGKNTVPIQSSPSNISDPSTVAHYNSGETKEKHDGIPHKR